MLRWPEGSVTPTIKAIDFAVFGHEVNITHSLGNKENNIHK